MKAFVTGGAGFIGSHLVEALVKEGHEVTVFDNLRSGKESNLSTVRGKITFIKGDITKPLDLEAIHGHDVCFHLAAIPSVPYSIEHPIEVHDVNATGTLNVLEACRKHHIKKVVYSSTAAVYGDEPTLPKTETSVIKALSPYAASKLAGEYYIHLYASLYNLPTVALRYFNVYGPRQDPTSPYSGVITKFVTLLRQGKQPTLFANGTNTRDFVYVGDIVQANIKAVNAPSGTYNAATGTQITIKELFDEIQQILKTRVTPINAPPLAGDIPHSKANITKIKTIGYASTTNLSQGLALTVQNL
ncbi:NAD-dependent epimerase/dehydratase family protein [Candidatus Woesearchaeota archaeon]|nr:NAD-dependent epimerase/dehydratase family protein [Candidatus Woesearchaeota archaeon]